MLKIQSEHQVVECSQRLETQVAGGPAGEHRIESWYQRYAWPTLLDRAQRSAYARFMGLGATGCC